MKRVLLFFIILTFGWGVKAQCPLSTAVDFTATDCHGTEVHLFDILDKGQYVLIDFFFYNCTACNETAPFMVQSYTAMGCNMHDVFYMEISDRDSDALCQTWTTNYGVEYPTISGVAGGATINDQYGISMYPTVILIAPDHSIVINDLWPINNAQTVINALAPYGIEEHDCNAPVVYNETLTFDTDTLWVSQDQNATLLTIFNNTEEPVVHLNKITIDTQDWFYFIYDNQQILLDEEFDIPIAQGESIQLNVMMNIFNKKEIVYPILSFENTLETVRLVTAIEWFESTQETKASSLTLFPNPANESVTLMGNDLCTVRIYNALGQKMNEFVADGNELRINTAQYLNGVYFIKTNEKTLRFVVNH